MQNNVPNYRQTEYIRNLKEFRGNSYSGEFRSTGVYDDRPGVTLYVLTHWNTVIAEITPDSCLTYFDARYISATTRGFQGRILNAMLQGRFFGAESAMSELARPTDQRGRIGTPVFA